MKGFAARLWRKEEGQSVTEYVLLLVLASLMAVSAIKAFASSLNNIYANASADIMAYYTRVQTEGNPRHHFDKKRSPARDRFGREARGHHKWNKRSD